MSSRFRWWFVALGAALVLIAAVGLGSWLALARYGPALTRERVERALADALGRPVRVERVVLRPWLARVSIVGVRVATGPTWDAGAMLDVRSTDVSIGLASLWAREVVLSRVRLTDVDLQLVASPGAEPFVLPDRIPDRLQLGPVTVRLGSFELERVHLIHDDRAARRLLELSGLAATARPAGGGLDITLDVAGARLSAANLDERVETIAVAAELRGQRLRLARLALRWRGEPLRVAGEISDLGRTMGLALDVRGRLPLAAVARLTGVAFTLEGVASIDGRVEGPAVAPSVATRVGVSDLRVGDVKARDASAQLTWRGGILDVADVKARALGGEVGGSLTLASARPERAQVTFRADQVALDALEAAIGQPLGVRGHVTGDGQLRGDLRRLIESEGRVRVESSDLALPAELSKLGRGAAKAEARLSGGQVEIVGAGGRWPGAIVSDVTGRVTPAGPAGLRAVVTADTGALAAAWGERRVSGQMTVAAHLGGHWSDLAIDGRASAGSLRIAGTPLDRVDVPFRLAGRTLGFTGVGAALGETRIAASGTARWSGQGPIDVARAREQIQITAEVNAPSARLEDLDPWIPPDWRGTGRFSLSGKLEGSLAGWRGTGTVAARELTVRGEPIGDLGARFVVTAAGVEAQAAKATVRSIPVEGAGEWAWTGEGRARGEIGPARLASVAGVPAAVGLDGTARASVEVARRAGVLSGSATINGTRVSVAGLGLGEGKLDATIRDGVVTARAAFPDARIAATASGRLGQGESIAVGVTFRDVDLTPVAGRLGDERMKAIGGTASGTAELRVPFSTPAAMTGVTRLDTIRLSVVGEEWRNRSQVVVHRQADATRLERAELEGRVGLITAAGTVADVGRLDLTVSGRFPLSIVPTLRPEVREASGRLDVDAKLSGTLAAPAISGDATLAAERIVARDVGPPRPAGRARFTMTQARVRIAEASASVSGGEVSASGEVRLVQPSARLDLKVTGRAPLTALATLRPEIVEAAGMLEVKASVGGTVAAPQAAGGGSISAGRIVLRDYPEALRNVEARFSLSPSGAHVERATASFAGGTLTVTGDLALRGLDLASYRFGVEARRVSLEPTPGFQTTWDADLELVGFESRGLLRGEARLVRGSYVSELPLLRLLLEPRSPGSAPATLALPLQVLVRLDDNLVVRTSVARFRAAGTVTLQGTTAAPILFGTLEAREGQLVFRKQRFTLTSAAARFTDPRRLDPFIDVQGRARIQSYDVTMSVTGRSEALEVHFTSSPALPEEDVLSLVAFGSTRGQLTKGGGTAVAGELAGLVIQDLFGLSADEGGGPVDVFQMETSESGTRSVKVGKRLNERASVSYSQGIENKNATERRLRVEYEIFGPLVVAGEQDFRGGFGGDVLLRLRFR